MSPDQSRRFVLMGVGGGGCNALGRMVANWSDGPRMVAVDIDRNAITTCGVEETQLIGEHLARGEGAGGDPQVGRMAAQDDLENLHEVVADADVLFLITTLGGGTGTGAAPVICQLAREAGTLVVCFATLPFSFEGEQRLTEARLGLRELRMRCDAVVVLPNDRLLDDDTKAEALVQSFGQSDHMVGIGARAMWKLLTEPGIMNAGFADVRRLIEQTDGTCSFGYGAGQGEFRVEMAMQELLTSALMDRGAQVAKCAGMVVNVIGGDDLTLAELDSVMSQLKSLARDRCEIVMGVSTEEALRDQVYITILAAEEWAVPDVEPAHELEEEAPAAEEESAEEPVPGEAAPVSTKRRGRRDKRKGLQEKLKLDPSGRGRFKGVEPTVYEGEDLDVPTFLRKGIKLSAET